MPARSHGTSARAPGADDARGGGGATIAGCGPGANAGGIGPVGPAVPGNGPNAAGTDCERDALGRPGFVGFSAPPNPPPNGLAAGALANAFCVDDSAANGLCTGADCGARAPPVSTC